jgi:DNA repair protein RadC
VFYPIQDLATKNCVQIRARKAYSSPSHRRNSGDEFRGIMIAKNNLSGADREHFVVMMLDFKNKVIGINTVAIGVLNSCPVHPREVFKPAIIANSANVILIHNHPSGDPAQARTIWR